MTPNALKPQFHIKVWCNLLWSQNTYACNFAVWIIEPGAVMYHPTIFTQTLNMDLESALAAMKKNPRGRPPKNSYNQEASSNGLKPRAIRPRPTEELYDSWSPSREEQNQIQGAMDILAARNISVVPVMNPSPASRESSPPLAVTSPGPVPAKTPPEYEDGDTDPDPDMDFAPMFCEVIVGQSDAQGSQPDSELSITPRVVLGSASRLDKCYRCDLCPRSYSSRAGLWYHKKAHSGDKQYSCYVCFKRFSQKSHLEVHIKYHRSRGQAPPWEPDSLDEKPEEGNRGPNSVRRSEEEEVGDAAAVGAEVELEVTRRSLSPNKGSSSFDNGRRGSPRTTPVQRGSDINFAQIFEGSMFKKDDDVAGGAAQEAIRHGSARYNDLIISAIPPSIPASEPRTLQSAQIQALLAKSPKLDKCYKCELCSNTYSSRAGLWYHRKTHLGNKQYTCKLCNQNFTQKGHLQAHMRTHEVEHPYACTHCDATFTDRASLESHMFTHTPGEKPFGCRQCGERFERQLQLIQHERTHAVNKPLKCPHCERSFAHKNNLVNHMRVHRSSADLAKIGL
ncbi:hypothetical protein FOCC_FOCC011249 [Frankliniella occidentalis]|nr:hypothetical protein FOCC_FOCC011249 [Frankliniella occidentalis]